MDDPEIWRPRSTIFIASSELESQSLRNSARIPESKPKSPSKPLSLCKACQEGPFAVQLGLFHPPLEWDSTNRVMHGGYTYFISMFQMHGRASAGCTWCKLLLRQITYQLEPPINEAYTPIGIKTEDLTGSFQIRVGFKASSPYYTPVGTQNLRVYIKQNSRLLNIHLQTSADDPAAPYIIARDPLLDVGSTRTLSLAKALIDECVDGHKLCRLTTPSLAAPFPSRVVDCTDLSRPRLVQTTGLHGTYFALSYVWGEAQPHKTTTSNISTYYDIIAPSTLPQTILDAIYITHIFGEEHLWVDSLCIIQDSDEDKLHEIGRMHLIYRNAYLTIIAASAERVSAGFLQDRPARPPPQITLPFICPPHHPTPGDDPGDAQHAVWGEVYSNPDYEDPEYKFPEEPVDGRGWCLQELCMSPRVLVFSSRSLHFRCQTTSQNVDNSIHLMRRTDPVRLHGILLHQALFDLPELSLRPMLSTIQPGSHYWNIVRDTWDDIVRQYSKRVLGKGSDKLVACGALAQVSHRILQCDYLAGLWRDTLFRDLLWWQWPRDSRCLQDRPEEYRAPSWSWASIDGQIQVPFRCDLSLLYASLPGAVIGAEVVCCDVTLKDREHPFGEVTGGFLVLRARLIPCKVRKNIYQFGADILFPPYSFNEDLDRFDARYNAMVEELGGSDCQIDNLSDLLTERGSDWLVPFWWIDGDDCDSSSWPTVGGLIVTLANAHSGSETENKVYRRIGTFQFGYDRNWGMLKHHALEENEITIE